MTVAGHSLSRTVTNTIWQGSSAGATDVLRVVYRASMLRSPSCELAWTAPSLHKEELAPHVMLSSTSLQTCFQLYTKSMKRVKILLLSILISIWIVSVRFTANGDNVDDYLVYHYHVHSDCSVVKTTSQNVASATKKNQT